MPGRAVVAVKILPVLHLIRPICASSVFGLAWVEERLLAVDPHTGYLLAIDPCSGLEVIANPRAIGDWLDVTGIAAHNGELWALRQDELMRVDRETMRLEIVMDLRYRGEGLAVSAEEWFVSVRSVQQIRVYSRLTGDCVRTFEAPGTGEQSLVYEDGHLWVSDCAEQTVYCLDPQSGQMHFSALTPYEQPTGLAFAAGSLYVAYSQVEDFIKQEPNRNNRLVIDSRSKTLIHQLHIVTEPQGRYTLSNGYLVEVIYCEETAALEPADLENVVWKIALPAESDRQKLIRVEAIGRPFREELEDGQRIAVFEFDKLAAGEVQLFGWRALLEVRGIRYHAPKSLDNPFPEEFKDRYLVDDDFLTMDARRVQEAAREAVGDRTGPLAKMLAIRDYVYDRLDYRIQRVSDTPDAVLARGKGSCGEYVGVLLALARLNGIPCRTVGRYKCPPLPDCRHYPLMPEYNHVWLEFYLDGLGWVPCESNVDDTGSRPYPRRYFMALPWYHIELGKGVTFETTNVRGYSLADLSLNHVQCTIVEELPTP
ncbi:transglutaminase family protein [Gloeobacter morelensis MG652769]|uniref:Transglutaminase family protein n=1 Tax=Gloeobacter morelensis MG652769 TaxID=2781736 RepID=A0ABY3PHK1_9CYAN|nr:transglutaminase family protein [Gloeobacter morelensis MG652769]